MIDRKKGIELITQFDIQGSTIAACAGRTPAEVSNYKKSLSLSSQAEISINRTVEEIIAIIAKASPIRPDLSNAENIKKLIRAWREDSVFCVMVTRQPTTYFLSRKDGKLNATNFLMQSTALDKEVAEQIADDLQQTGYKTACAIQNPYGLIDQRYSMESYQELMGAEAASEASNA